MKSKKSEGLLEHFLNSFSISIQNLVLTKEHFPVVSEKCSGSIFSWNSPNLTPGKSQVINS